MVDVRAHREAFRFQAGSAATITVTAANADGDPVDLTSHTLTLTPNGETAIAATTADPEAGTRVFSFDADDTALLDDAGKGSISLADGDGDEWIVGSAWASTVGTTSQDHEVSVTLGQANIAITVSAAIGAGSDAIYQYVAHLTPTSLDVATDFITGTTFEIEVPYVLPAGAHEIIVTGTSNDKDGAYASTGEVSEGVMGFEYAETQPLEMANRGKLVGVLFDGPSDYTEALYVVSVGEGNETVLAELGGGGTGLPIAQSDVTGLTDALAGKITRNSVLATTPTTLTGPAAVLAVADVTLPSAVTHKGEFVEVTGAGNVTVSCAGDDRFSFAGATTYAVAAGSTVTFRAIDGTSIGLPAGLWWAANRTGPEVDLPDWSGQTAGKAPLTQSSGGPQWGAVVTSVNGSSGAVEIEAGGASAQEVPTEPAWWITCSGQFDGGEWATPNLGDLTNGLDIRAKIRFHDIGASRYAEILTQTHDAGVGSWDNFEFAVWFDETGTTGEIDQPVLFYEFTPEGGGVGSGIGNPSPTGEDQHRARAEAGLQFNAWHTLRLTHDFTTREIKLWREVRWGEDDETADGRKWQEIAVTFDNPDDSVADSIDTGVTEDWVIGYAADMDVAWLEAYDGLDGTQLIDLQESHIEAAGVGATSVTDGEGNPWTTTTGAVESNEPPAATPGAVAYGQDEGSTSTATTLTSLLDAALDLGSLAAGDVIRGTVAVTHANSSGGSVTHQLGVYLNGTQVAVFTAPSLANGTRTGIADFVIRAQSLTDVNGALWGQYPSGQPPLAAGQATVSDLSAGCTVDVYGAVAGANQSLTVQFVTAEKIPA